jgi:hypothetical protein
MDQQPTVDFPIHWLLLIHVIQIPSDLSDIFAVIHVIRGITVTGFLHKRGKPVAAAERTAGAQLFHVKVDRYDKVMTSGESVSMGFPAHIPPHFAFAVNPGIIVKNQFCRTVNDNAELESVMRVADKFIPRQRRIFPGNIVRTENRERGRCLFFDFDPGKICHDGITPEKQKRTETVTASVLKSYMIFK